MLRSPCPTRASLSEPAAQMLREAGYRQRPTARDLVVHRRGQRRRVLLPAAPRHRDLRRVGHASTWASPGRTCCSTAGRRPRRSCRLGFAASTFRLAVPAGRRAHRRRTSTAGGSPRPTPACSTTSSAERGVAGRGRPARRGGRERGAPRRRRRRRRRRRHRRHAAPGRPRDDRRAAARQRGAADPARGVEQAGEVASSSVGSRASSSPAPT